MDDTRERDNAEQDDRDEPLSCISQRGPTYVPARTTDERGRAPQWPAQVLRPPGTASGAAAPGPGVFQAHLISRRRG